MLGPADGRYLVRGRADEERLDVVAFRTLGAPRARLFRERRSRRIDSDRAEPRPVPITRATVIPADAFHDEAQARQWLDLISRNDERADDFVKVALRRINQVVHAHRLAAADPYLRDVSRAQPLQVRIGYGSGDEVADGRWRGAYELPPAPPSRKRSLIEPGSEAAAILAGRRSTFASEELLLRAQLDFDQGRIREATLQASLAARTLEAEGRQVKEIAERLARLAEAALTNPSNDTPRDELGAALGELGRIARRRRHGRD